MDDDKKCEFDEDENGWDCYEETNNNDNFPHDWMLLKGDGSNDDKRRICALLLFEEADGPLPDCDSLTSPTHVASKSYTVGDSEDQLDVGEFILSPSVCAVSYSTSTTPSAAFMTPLASGTGMKW